MANRSLLKYHSISPMHFRDHRGRDRKVVGSTTTCAISVYSAVDSNLSHG
jgi:hypothetical protein